nr:MAG TPA: hypothetical protein [Caudoviricetes sp.]
MKWKLFPLHRTTQSTCKFLQIIKYKNQINNKI